MEKEEVRQNILKEIEKVERRIVEYKELTQPVEPDCAIGRISRMDAINNKSVTEASLRQAEEKMRNLQRVLSQVGTKDFGICIKCGKEIPAGRILYRPESLTCVNCAK
ncbi:MAG: TraR/DksA family transcriptional regulator [Bacteroidetes bacterium]|nr:TraR/DksA family transcriptional regulator [Bacteroidota bacterium]